MPKGRAVYTKRIQNKKLWRDVEINDKKITRRTRTKNVRPRV
jgi:hypothetical protein